MLSVSSLSPKLRGALTWRALGLAFLACLTLSWLLFNGAPAAHIPPIDGALTFISIGSFGTGSRTQYAVARQMTKVAKKMNIHIVLGLGDNFFPNGVTDINDAQFRYSLKSVYKRMRAVWFPALGRNDHNGNVSAVTAFARQYKMWGSDSNYYSISFAVPDGSKVDLVVTDSVPLESYLGRTTPKHCQPAQHDSFESGVFSGMKELMWMKRAMADSNADWVIVTGNSPVWSGGLRKVCPTERVFQKEMNRILAEAGVDVYMSGADHNAQVIMGDGNVHHIINGVGSLPPEPVVNIPGRSMFTATGFNGFAVHQLTRDVMRTTWVDKYGVLRGSSEIRSKCALSGTACSKVREHMKATALQEFLSSPLGMHEAIPSYFKVALEMEKTKSSLLANGQWAVKAVN